MSTSTEEISQLDIMGYADGQLEAPRRQEVERELTRHPELLATAQAIALQNEAIRAAYGGVVHEPVPPRLISHAERPDNAARRLARMRRVAAVVALTLAAGVAGWWGGTLPDDQGDDARRFVEAAASDHLAWTDPSVPPFASASLAPRAQPLEWLSDRLTLEVGTPNLVSHGYHSIAKALVEIDGRPTVKLTFERDDGDSVSLFLTTRWRESPPTFNVEADAPLPSVYWFDGPLMWTLTGSNSAELTELAEAIHGMTRVQPTPTGNRVLPNNIVDLDPLTPPAVPANVQ